ncbi:aldehyde dehydrogenase family protein [Actinocorallia populi]|uniref:aldehyde dehydrogenase family protein n=1 Tax=Actinocorallia populi TaxID=2079200 RepID=UPI000D087488|nr:aldehyde dehydrogenase family protein [Actinocorallia populi]
MRDQGRLWVGGAWTAPSDGGTIEVVSPHTEQVVARVAAAGPEDVDRAVDVAREAFEDGPWPRLEPAERAAVIRAAAHRYGLLREDIAQTVTAQMGAPITFARSGHTDLPWAMMRSLADVAEGYQWEESSRGLHGEDLILRHEPLGVVAAIIPWNMPMLVAVSRLVPALLAGCPVILKPSPRTPLDAYLLAEALDQAGLPPGLVSVLPAGPETGEYLVSHLGVDKVFFTGSSESCWKVAAISGAADKQISLGLGGRSAAIVLDDADPAAVAAGIKTAGLMNNGQIRIAQTRILLPRSRYAHHLDALASMVGGLAVGDPAEPSTDIGPLATRRQQQRVHDHIERALRRGARALVGGTGLPSGIDRGWYVRPTLLADTDPGFRPSHEQAFGPVLTVIPYDDEEEAVRLAEDAHDGLSGSVWTPDIDRGLALARRVHSDTFGINQAHSMHPDHLISTTRDANGIGSCLTTRSITITPA